MRAWQWWHSPYGCSWDRRIPWDFLVELLLHVGKISLFWGQHMICWLICWVMLAQIASKNVQGFKKNNGESNGWWKEQFPSCFDADGNFRAQLTTSGSWELVWVSYLSYVSKHLKVGPSWICWMDRKWSKNQIYDPRNAKNCGATSESF